MASEAENFSGKQILIIDDRSPFVYSMSDALRNEGCSVSVTNEEDLREKIVRGDIIDLILVDEQMPKEELEGLISATRQTAIPTPHKTRVGVAYRTTSSFHGAVFYNHHGVSFGSHDIIDNKQSNFGTVCR